MKSRRYPVQQYLESMLTQMIPNVPYLKLLTFLLYTQIFHLHVMLFSNGTSLMLRVPLAHNTDIVPSHPAIRVNIFVNMFIKLEIYHSSTISNYTTNNFYSLQCFNRHRRPSSGPRRPPMTVETLK